MFLSKNTNAVTVIFRSILFIGDAHPMNRNYGNECRVQWSEKETYIKRPSPKYLHCKSKVKFSLATMPGFFPVQLKRGF